MENYFPLWGVGLAQRIEDLGAGPFERNDIRFYFAFSVESPAWPGVPIPAK
jgi:hypothetical protein